MCGSGVEIIIWLLHNLLLVLLISQAVVGSCVSQGVTAKKGRETGK